MTTPGAAGGGAGPAASALPASASVGDGGPSQDGTSPLRSRAGRMIKPPPSYLIRTLDDEDDDEEEDDDEDPSAKRARTGTARAAARASPAVARQRPVTPSDYAALPADALQVLHTTAGQPVPVWTAWPPGHEVPPRPRAPGQW
jgi:hypothetical protein